MYSVWFCDLEKVIQTLKEKVPTMQLFTNIEGNADGDFVIKSDKNTYIVSHKDFKVYKLLDDDWKGHEWVLL